MRREFAESEPLTLTGRVAALNARSRRLDAARVLEIALSEPELGRVAVVSSFGAESAVLLHLVSLVDRSVPVLFIDTEMLFPETLAYQSELAERLGLSDVRTIRAGREDVAREDAKARLHLSDPDACCNLRKTQPLQRALRDFDTWITGRKRFQGGQRSTLEHFESEANLRIKVNPLAHWSGQDLRRHMEEHHLPRHPLVSQGYLSIGCAPCTTRVEKGEDPRAGRWRDRDKVECGIHFVDGKFVRGPGVAA